jgi:hypothetical protein
MRRWSRLLTLLVGVNCLALLAAAPWPAHAAPPAGQRDFYGALDDTLGDFEFDLKHELVKGVEDISIRNVSLSENIPRAFAPHVEDLVIERILKATKTKVIQCVGCKARRMTLESGGTRIRTTSPRTNAQELAALAKKEGIQHFLDVSFTYQPNGLLMSLEITEASDATLTWSKTYNSETSRAALLRRGYDPVELDPSQRRITEYPSVLQYRLRVDYLVEPDVGGYSGCLGFSLRMVERYDNRKKELGFEFQYLRGSATLLHADAANASLYSGVNATLVLLHAWNLIGAKEDFNQARVSVYGGLGGTFTSGFLGALFRVGAEYRLASHAAVTAQLGYRPSSTSFLPLGDGQSVSGVEPALGVSYLF